MNNYFSGETANDVWNQAHAELNNNSSTLVAGRTGDTYELLHAVFSISNPRERWVTHRLPPISIAFALAEVVWIMASSNDAAVINFWNPPLQRYSGTGETYHGAYGYRIRKRFGRDQFIDAYNTLSHNSQSRQAVIMIWNPEDDQPNQFGVPVSSDIPCNICSMLKIRNSSLEWTQILRSNDIFLGVPYNFVQFTMLQEIMAGWLNVGLGTYTHFSDSLHLYLRDSGRLSSSQISSPPNSDNLMADKETCSKILEWIYENMMILSSGKNDENTILEKAFLKSGKKAYDNIMLILAAYAAKRAGYDSLKGHLIENCENHLYKHLWRNWEVQNSENRGDVHHETEEH
ncbi:thymidylate synthase [Cohnella soli]|uniref:thymidylate synthase n=1 Tax=Cohnella soli TaxID=425005 RepID=A0ABW0HVQ3_9BACL